MENGMEWKENFGMEYERRSEWNGIKDLKNGMEDCLPYFHTNYIDYTVYVTSKTAVCLARRNTG